MADEINTQDLAVLVRRKLSQGTNLRDAAREAGVSPATLSRVQRGHAPDANALVALARWLQIPIDRVLNNPPRVGASVQGSTLEKVEMHLRADPRLSAETAGRIAEVFRAVYEQFAERAPVDGERG